MRLISYLYTLHIHTFMYLYIFVFLFVSIYIYIHIINPNSKYNKISIASSHPQTNIIINKQQQYRFFNYK